MSQYQQGQCTRYYLVYHTNNKCEKHISQQYIWPVFIVWTWWGRWCTSTYIQHIHQRLLYYYRYVYRGPHSIAQDIIRDPYVHTVHRPYTYTFPTGYTQCTHTSTLLHICLKICALFNSKFTVSLQSQFCIHHPSNMHIRTNVLMCTNTTYWLVCRYTSYKTTPTKSSVYIPPDPYPGRTNWRQSYWHHTYTIAWYTISDISAVFRNFFKGWQD